MDSRNLARFESGGVFKIASGFENECELIEFNLAIGPNILSSSQCMEVLPLADSSTLDQLG